MALLHAIQSRNINRIQGKVDKLDEMIAEYTSYDSTALLFFLSWNCPLEQPYQSTMEKIVPALLDKKIDVHAAKDEAGRSLLHTAIMGENEYMVSCLLDRGAVEQDINYCRSFNVIFCQLEELAMRKLASHTDSKCNLAIHATKSWTILRMLMGKHSCSQELIAAQRTPLICSEEKNSIFIRRGVAGKKINVELALKPASEFIQATCHELKEEQKKIVCVVKNIMDSWMVVSTASLISHHQQCKEKIFQWIGQQIDFVQKQGYGPIFSEEEWSQRLCKLAHSPISKAEPNKVLSSLQDLLLLMKKSNAPIAKIINGFVDLSVKGNVAGIESSNKFTPLQYALLRVLHYCSTDKKRSMPMPVMQQNLVRSTTVN